MMSEPHLLSIPVDYTVRIVLNVMPRMVQQIHSDCVRRLVMSAWGGWKPNTNYVISFWAKATGGLIGNRIILRWNTNPAQTKYLSRPFLTDEWQRSNSG